MLRQADLVSKCAVNNFNRWEMFYLRTLQSFLLPRAGGKNFDLPKPNKETHRPLNSHDPGATPVQDSKKRATTNKESAFRYISSGAATNFCCGTRANDNGPWPAQSDFISPGHVVNYEPAINPGEPPPPCPASFKPPTPKRKLNPRFLLSSKLTLD